MDDLVLKLDAMLDLERVERWLKQAMLFELNQLIAMGEEYGLPPEAMQHLFEARDNVSWLWDIERSPVPVEAPPEMEIKGWVQASLEELMSDVASSPTALVGPGEPGGAAAPGPARRDAPIAQ